MLKKVHLFPNSSPFFQIRINRSPLSNSWLRGPAPIFLSVSINIFYYVTRTRACKHTHTQARTQRKCLPEGLLSRLAVWWKDQQAQALFKSQVLQLVMRLPWCYCCRHCFLTATIGSLFRLGCSPPPQREPPLRVLHIVASFYTKCSYDYTSFGTTYKAPNILIILSLISRAEKKQVPRNHGYVPRFSVLNK